MTAQQNEQVHDEHPEDGIPEAPWKTTDDPEVLRARIQELEYLQTLTQTWSGEAPGTAWCKLYTPMGAEITLSSRAASPEESLNGLVSAIKQGRKHYNLSTSRPSAPSATAGTPTGGEPPVVTRPPAQGQPATPPAPAAATLPQAIPPSGGHAGPATAGNGTPILITAVAAMKTKKGDVYLRVKGGAYTKFGVPAYDRVLPKDILAQISQWPTDQDYAIPPSWGITKALVDESGERKSVVALM